MFGYLCENTESRSIEHTETAQNWRKTLLWRLFVTTLRLFFIITLGNITLVAEQYPGLRRDRLLEVSLFRYTSFRWYDCFAKSHNL